MIMEYIILLSIGAFFFMIACNTEEPGCWTEQQVSEWFDQKDWLGTSQLKPDSSINKRELAIQYHQNKDRWDIALTFLNEEDLVSLPVGIHEIDGKEVFVMVSEYNSKNHEDVPYESHKKYTDIQYVVSGIEYIGQADLTGISLITPYDSEGDTAFYENVENGQHLLAQSDRFFIFFPGMGHSPGRKVENSVPVKKIVIKVKS